MRWNNDSLRLHHLQDVKSTSSSVTAGESEEEERERHVLSSN